jgi:S-formylglutathione hydrolase FrmB
VIGSEDDLLHLVDTFPTDAPKPRLYIACGTEDFLYDQNICFRDHLNGKGFTYCYEEGPGEHTWEFCDKYIKEFIKTL